jgi:hypothetical protein
MNVAGPRTVTACATWQPSGPLRNTLSAVNPTPNAGRTIAGGDHRALQAQQRVGWLPSQFLSAAPKPNAPSSSPSGWAASGTGETPSSAGPFFSKGDFVTEPRDLTDLVPADVRTELAAAVAALELHGPAVTKALQRLDRATTAAWLVQRRR